jgi:hypothetical protein
MRELLRGYPPGVPAETLLVRIKGRRSYLVENWDRLLMAPEPLKNIAPAPWRAARAEESGPIWQALQGEYAWVFRWMGEPLRRVTAPFFWLTELRTLGICLRYQSGGHEIGDDLLEGSLLGEPIRAALRTTGGGVGAVKQLAEILIPHAPRCAGLVDRFREGGSGAVEAALQDIFLEELAARRLHPVMGGFVTLAIDCGNLIAVAKRLRWRSAVQPQLLDGGSLPPKRLAQLFARQDVAALARLGANLGGEGQGGDPGELERTVLQARYRAVRRMAREPSGVGAIIDYLWRCRNEARAFGLIARLATAGMAGVDEELIR